MEWRIHAPEKWRPLRAIHPCMEQLLQEELEVQLILVPLHLGMWHPLLTACPGRWKRAMDKATIWWRPHGGASMRVFSGVPQSHTCIAVDGEGPPD